MLPFLTLGIPYKITVYTGDKRNGGTDANVFITMHRKKTSSQKIFLPDGKFERKSIDEFTITGPPDLSPLSGLDVGHDNDGAAPGWFLDKVCHSRRSASGFSQILIDFSFGFSCQY